MSKSINQVSGTLRFTLTNDYLFHIVFQENEALLKGLLCSLLHLREEEIVKVRLENPIDPGDNADDKEIILDLLIILNDNRRINIEMQVLNGKDGPERSLTYLCRSFDSLKTGRDYLAVLPTIHIGILDFTLFPEHPEFYSRYAMMNIKYHNIYSDKLLLHVLDLTQIQMASDDDISCGLKYWSRLFKAKTWEEIKMLASEYKPFENVADTMQRALSDKEIRLKCEARERYERDRISLYASGRREGHAAGLAEGHASGLAEGHASGLAEGISQSIEKSIQMLKAANMPMDFVKQQLMEHYHLTEVDALEKINLYWK